MTQSGIEAETFQLVAQFLNHRVSLFYIKTLLKLDIKRTRSRLRMMYGTFKCTVRGPGVA
jgi:hypothetical protein